jgi:6-phosphofructokinase 1
MHMIQNANEENNGSCPADPVLVMQAMGRKIGFIPAAARLADPNREMPLQIYLAESPCSLDQLTDNVNDQLKATGRCMAVVSEGFDVGDVGQVKDSFGHTMFSSSQLTVAQIVVNHLNKVGLAAKGAARANVPGTDQRHATAYASTVDLEEAYRSGQMAALLAARGESGYMATILRAPGSIYTAQYDKVPLEKVAAADRSFPKKWIAENGYDVTDEFVKYARPLVGEDMVTLPIVDGRQRLAKIEKIFAPKKLPPYVLQGNRKK